MEEKERTMSSDSSDEKASHGKAGGKTTENKFNKSLNSSHHCEKCDKSFRLRSSYLVHMDRHAGKNYQCDTCGKSFSANYSLALHQKSHATGRNYDCEVCGKSYSSKNGFTVHQKSHAAKLADRKPFKCPICGKRFVVNYKLKRHETIHKDKNTSAKDGSISTSDGTEEISDTKVKNTSAKEGSCSTTSDAIEESSSTKGKSYACDLCGKSYAQKRSLTLHLKSHATDPADRLPFKCPVCDKRFLTDFKCRRHKLIHKDKNTSVKDGRGSTASYVTEEIAGTKDKRYACDVCGKSYTKKCSMTVHLQSHATDPADRRPYKCPVCGKRFTVNYKLRIHELSHKGAGFACDVCGKSYSVKWSLTQHLKSHATDPEDRLPFKCPVCDKRFLTDYKCRRHQAMHKGAGFACDVCGKSYSVKWSLTQHLKSHATDPEDRLPFKCPVCDKRFLTDYKCRRHQAMHKDQKETLDFDSLPPIKPTSSKNKTRPKSKQLFKCKLCNKLYNGPSSLRVHIQKHMGKKYTCKVCNKSFSASDTLKNHMLFHDGVKPWICGRCGAQFRLRCHMIRHEKWHTREPDEKTQVCEICGKSFYTQGYLNSHRKIHEDARSYQCPICGKGFNQSSSLILHRRIHEKDKKYKCNICTRGFDQKKTLEKHQALHANGVVRKKNILLPPVAFCDICGIGLSSKRGLQKHLKKHREGILKLFNSRSRRNFTAIDPNSQVNQDVENKKMKTDVPAERIAADVHYEVINCTNENELDSTEEDSELRFVKRNLCSDSVWQDFVKDVPNSDTRVISDKDKHADAPVKAFDEIISKCAIKIASQPVKTIVEEPAQIIVNQNVDKIASQQTGTKNPTKTVDNRLTKQIGSRSASKLGLNMSFEKELSCIIQDKMENDNSLEIDPVEREHSNYVADDSNQMIAEMDEASATEKAVNRKAEMDESVSLSAFIAAASSVTEEAAATKADQDKDSENNGVLENSRESADGKKDTPLMIAAMVKASVTTKAAARKADKDKDSENYDILEDCKESADGTKDTPLIDSDVQFEDGQSTVIQNKTINGYVDLDKESSIVNDKVLDEVCESDIASESGELFINSDYDSDATEIMEQFNETENNKWSANSDIDTLAASAKLEPQSADIADLKDFTDLNDNTDDTVPSSEESHNEMEIEVKDEVIDDVTCMKNTYETLAKGWQISSVETWNVELNRKTDEKEQNEEQLTNNFVRSSKQSVNNHSNIAEVVSELPSNNTANNNRQYSVKNENGTEKETEHESGHLDLSSADDITGAPNNRCEICNKVFKHHRYLRKHLRLFHPDKEVVYKCSKGDCEETFTCQRKYRQHLLSHNIIICVLCNRVCRTANDLIGHVQRTHDAIGEKVGDKVACMLCTELFENELDADEHWKTHKVLRSIVNDPNAELYRCDHCSKTFQCKQSLMRHTRFHGIGKKLRCEDCGKVFRQEDHLQRHVQSKACSQDFECFHCDQKFHTAGQLRVHLKSDHNEQAYECPFCPKKYATSSALYRHKQFHTEGSAEINQIKPFMCSICGKCYTAAHSLKTHVITHSGTRPFQCDSCDSSYKQRSHLLRHVATYHKGIRKFKCSEQDCGKAFADRQALNTHMRVHTKEKPYKCSECNKAFTQPQILTVHMKTHLSTKEFECLFCKQQLSTKMSLLRHMKRHKDSAYGSKARSSEVRSKRTKDSTYGETAENGEVRSKQHKDSAYGETAGSSEVRSKQHKDSAYGSTAGSSEVRSKQHKDSTYGETAGGSEVRSKQHKDSAYGSTAGSSEVRSKQHKDGGNFNRPSWFPAAVPAAGNHEVRLKKKRKIVRKMAEKQYKCERCDRAFTTHRATVHHIRKFCPGRLAGPAVGEASLDKAGDTSVRKEAVVETRLEKAGDAIRKEGGVVFENVSCKVTLNSDTPDNIVSNALPASVVSSQYAHVTQGECATSIPHIVGNVGITENSNICPSSTVNTITTFRQLSNVPYSTFAQASSGDHVVDLQPVAKSEASDSNGALQASVVTEQQQAASAGVTAPVVNVTHLTNLQYLGMVHGVQFQGYSTGHY